MKTRQTEIGDPELAPIIHQQVRGFDVSMDHADLVGVIESLRCLPSQVGHRAKESGGGKSG